MTREEVAQHEACHAASFLEDRIAIRDVRIDLVGTSAGMVRVDLGRLNYDRESIEKVLVGTLTGAVYEKKTQIGWPPKPGDWGRRCAADAANATRIALGLDFGSADWHRSLWLAEKRYHDAEFQELVATIATELLRRGELSGLQLEKIYAQWLGATALK